MRGLGSVEHLAAAVKRNGIFSAMHTPGTSDDADVDAPARF
jgi:hypothetical protein